MLMREPPACLFVGQTPPSVVPQAFIGGGYMAEICFKSVCRVEAQLNTQMPVHHNRYMQMNGMPIRELPASLFIGRTLSKRSTTDFLKWRQSGVVLFLVCSCYGSRATHSNACTSYLIMVAI